jgi:hypothetical protein
VSASRWYWIGTGAVAAVAMTVALSTNFPDRRSVVTGISTALALQVPLGWWVVGHIGTPQLLAIWGIGMLTRFTVLALFGFAIVPAFGLASGPALLSLAGTMAALLAVESVASTRHQSRDTV